MSRARQKPAKSPVRAPVQRRSRSTRAAILRAAAQLLGQRGYAQCTTNHIARRAGVSIGSVYEYFRDKDAIVQALIDEHLTGAEQLFAARASEFAEQAHSRPLRAVLGALVETMLMFHADDPKAHRVLSREVRLSREARARVAALEEGSVRLLIALFSAHPEARVRRPAVAARVVVEAVDALAHRWVLEPSGQPVPLSQLADELTRMLTAYLTAPDAREPRPD